MLRSIFILAAAYALSPFSFAHAEGVFKSKPAGEKKLQISSVFTNDFLGDGDDRWRTGSLDVSATFGGGDLRELPEKAWERYQLRFRGEIISPSNISTPSATDRQYAGVLGLGLFTHFQKNSYDVYYGGELVFVGENTGIGALQRNFHEELDILPPSAAVLNNQIPNATYPTVHGGLSKSFRSERRLIRPFAEVQAGVESFARVGMDIVLGGALIDDFLLRDSVSGQLVSHSKADDSKGFGFLMGADAAYVVDSNYLPNSGTLAFENLRPRARAGVVYQQEKFGLFYGISWLGKEFEAQRSSQVVGSLNINVSF
ncbi:lipid A-modifier LpxR family protein [Amylibacter sp. SFDW26]|uniref:lipid A-modifier LpxR family protein n=1 Tax=Amylibacter sp. SFDW26 TaxID=2652722 RepID=UPI001869AB5F|nr:lipid A-modifier LpxR family protein [Amylibacter sp. SFDW26]